MNKFLKMLTAESSAIKAKRAEILETSTKGAFNVNLNDINYKISQKEMELERLTDIAPENTYDLKPGGNNFNPNDWVESIIKIKVDLYNLNVKKDIILEAKKEWFDVEK